MIRIEDVLDLQLFHDISVGKKDVAHLYLFANETDDRPSAFFMEYHISTIDHTLYNEMSSQ